MRMLKQIPKNQIRRVIQVGSEKKRRRLTAIDYFIIFAVIAVLVAAGLRIYEDSRPVDSGTPTADEEYIVSFVSKGMKESTAKLLEKGEIFYLTGGQTEFGVLEDNPTVTPQKIRVELASGELKTDVYAEKNGNNTKVDVTGTFRVKGCRNKDDLMYVAGSLYVAPNMPVTVFSDKISLSFTVTDIEQVT